VARGRCLCVETGALRENQRGRVDDDLTFPHTTPCIELALHW